jgi:hypothetical protein
VNVTPVFRVHLHPRAWEVGAFFLFDPPTVCCVEPALEKLDGEGLRNQMFGDYLALRCAAGVVPPPHFLSCQGQGAGRKPHRTCGLMMSPPANILQRLVLSQLTYVWQVGVEGKG